MQVAGMCAHQPWPMHDTAQAMYKAMIEAAGVDDE